MNDLMNYIAIPIFILTGILFTTLGLGFAKLLRPDHPTPEKLLAYECGEEAIGSAHVNFNSKFYIIGLLFVLFEIEMVFLFPAVLVIADVKTNLITDKMWAWLAVSEVIVFILALSTGLIYAWRSGFLEWQMGGQKPTDFISVVPSSLYEKVNQRSYATNSNDPTRFDTAA